MITHYGSLNETNADFAIRKCAMIDDQNDSSYEEEELESIVDDNRDITPYQVLNLLKLELAIRIDNEHIGTGMGGNPSQFFFLLSNKVVPVYGKTYAFHQHPNHIEMVFDSDRNMKKIRNALNGFFFTHPKKNSYTDEELVNLSFLRDRVNPSLDVQLLTQAVEVGTKLVPWLEHKKQFQKDIRKFFKKEYDYITASFLKEINLPEDFFQQKHENKSHLEFLKNEWAKVSKLLDGHPVWGIKKEAVQARCDNMIKSLLSQEDLDKMALIGSFPEYITLFVFRSMVTIDRVIELNLDEQEQTKWMEVINKRIKSLDKN